MRTCKRCEKRQTNDPTALPRVIAAVNGFCTCWYDATERLRQEREALIKALPEIRAEAARIVAEGADERAAQWAKAAEAEADLVEWMEEIAPVHLRCDEEGCHLCSR